jgi:gamma-glutamylcysteine synthetase
MKHYINIVWEGRQEVDEIVAEMVMEGSSVALLESETNVEIYETETETVLAVETHRALSEQESNEVAEKIAHKLFDLGYESFDIEISV